MRTIIKLPAQTTPECWSQDAKITTWMNSNQMQNNYNKLLQHFETKFHGIASSIKRSGMRWEEVRYAMCVGH